MDRVRDLTHGRDVGEEKLLENQRQKRYKNRKGEKRSRATARADLSEAFRSLFSMTQNPSHPWVFKSKFQQLLYFL